MAHSDPFGASQTLDGKTYYSLKSVSSLGDIASLPFSIRVLLESCLRNFDGRIVTEDHIRAVCAYDPQQVKEVEVPFMPARVVLQDFTGVPALVDLAAMRSAMSRLGGRPDKVNPLVPCDLVIDHSVQVDAFNSGEALKINAELEFERNKERYEFLKWGQSAFRNFRVVPPATGIVHQVNLEYLAKVVWEQDGVIFPDSLVGTDSHTTMINGLGVVGWGVGGIEAEACMLGQPIYMLLPEVIGFRLTGQLPEGSTATDLVLVVTQMLRKHGVVGKFVEFFGPGLANMPVATRATIGNMAPEYGATIGYFPVDEQTLAYLKLSGRPESLIALVEKYCKLQGLWHDESSMPRYSAVLELDLSTVSPSLAGPKRPQDRVALVEMKTAWEHALAETYGKHANESAKVSKNGTGFELRHGSVVIAAITSCTNTSNPEVMIGAGLLAKKAAEKGLKPKPWVKTSLAPGSKVVTEYLERANLMASLEAMGFYLVGYGCTTCIGNSGPLPEPISQAINDHDLVAAAVLSGNRNFEGRVNPDVKANYLASPPLCIAYAIAGTVDIDLSREPLGTGADGKPVYLKDIWPTQQEIQQTIQACVSRDQFVREYSEVFEGSDLWREIKTSDGGEYDWPESSTYIQEPPFFKQMTQKVESILPIQNARCLAMFGDSITTDHISPAGSIKPSSPAGLYLQQLGVRPHEFNSYGSRRGNDRVMVRGTFANVRIKNLLAPGTEGGFTTDFSDGQLKTIYDAAMNYQRQRIPLIVIAGKDYGMGSSRDWAAKGTMMLGVKAVIAESFERIHRSNLVGMGVLPLTFVPGQSAESLHLQGDETYSIPLDQDLKPKQVVRVKAVRPDGSCVGFDTICRIDTPVEVEYYRNGGILHMVLRRMLAN